MSKEDKKLAKAAKLRIKKTNQAIDRAAAGISVLVILAALVQELMDRGVVTLHPFSIQKPGASNKK